MTGFFGFKPETNGFGKHTVTFAIVFTVESCNSSVLQPYVPCRLAEEQQEAVQGADTTITDLQHQIAAMQEAAVEQLGSVRSEFNLYKQKVQAYCNLEC